MEEGPYRTLGDLNLPRAQHEAMGRARGALGAERSDEFGEGGEHGEGLGPMRSMFKEQAFDLVVGGDWRRGGEGLR